MNVHPAVEEAIDEIDAAIFTGDAFINAENIKEMERMMTRWQRGLDSHKELIADIALEEQK